MRVRAGFVTGPGMVVEIIPTVDDMLDLDLGDEHNHIECCRVSRFFCGAQFHPELSADESVKEEECCATCVEIMYEMLCPPLTPTHSHCPIPVMGRMICPDPRQA